jgi:hypothetical protein
MTAPPPGTHRAATREPMFWLVWGLPAVVVAASIATLVIALRAGGADAVPAEVRRTAQIQVEDMQADLEAQRLVLHGELHRARDTGALRLALSGTALPDDPQLRLRLRHPALAQSDRELMLVRSNDEWHGRIELDVAHAWNLELQPLDARWRLTGRLAQDAASAPLQPRLRQ